MNRIIVSSLLIVCSTIAFAKPELKGNPDDLRTFLHPKDKVVSIFAEAEEKAYSDKAIISLVVTTEDKLLSQSLSKNSVLREQITKQLANSGIEQENVKSSKFSTSPQYGWFGEKPNSYKVVNRMAISILEENQLQEIAAVADENDEVELSDTTFEHTKKEEVENKVKEKALAKVMKQKKFYEENLGVKLTPVGFRKANQGHTATRGALILEEVVVTAQKRSSSLRDSPARITAYDSGAESSFDEVQYKSGIYVDFKIEASAK